MEQARTALNPEPEPETAGHIDLNVADHPTGNPFDHTNPANDEVTDQ